MFAYIAERLIEPNDPLEVEIRGVSVHAIEKIKVAIARMDKQQQFPDINSVMLDTYLWSYAMKNHNHCQKIPHHKTRTYFY